MCLRWWEENLPWLPEGNTVVGNDLWETDNKSGNGVYNFILQKRKNNNKAGHDQRYFLSYNSGVSLKTSHVQSHHNWYGNCNKIILLSDTFHELKSTVVDGNLSRFSGSPLLGYSLKRKSPKSKQVIPWLGIGICQKNVKHTFSFTLQNWCYQSCLKRNPAYLYKDNAAFLLMGKFFFRLFFSCQHKSLVVEK